jgi:hypothetical protein
MARKSGAVCPPGIFCLTPGVVVFLMFILVGLIGGIAYMKSIETVPGRGSDTGPHQAVFQ